MAVWLHQVALAQTYPTRGQVGGPFTFKDATRVKSDLSVWLTPPLGELEKVVNGADDRPLGAHVLEAA
jgi:hypothetical protein